MANIGDSLSIASRGVLVVDRTKSGGINLSYTLAFIINASSELI